MLYFKIVCPGTMAQTYRRNMHIEHSVLLCKKTPESTALLNVQSNHMQCVLAFLKDMYSG
jgi:hypothetical protein